MVYHLITCLPKRRILRSSSMVSPLSSVLTRGFTGSIAGIATQIFTFFGRILGNLTTSYETSSLRTQHDSLCFWHEQSIFDILFLKELLWTSIWVSHENFDCKICFNFNILQLYNYDIFIKFGLIYSNASVKWDQNYSELNTVLSYHVSISSDQS